MHLGSVFKDQYPDNLTKVLGKVLPEYWEKDMEVVSHPLDERVDVRVLDPHQFGRLDAVK